ncbi:MAG TPA: GTP-binding protein [Mycobacteriales bacterium]|nr:GTP-binding protein [Mycobacteriales bacterium]
MTAVIPGVEQSRLLRVATAGSVDDGKSTLIGRLLYDAKAVLADQLTAVQDASRRRGYPDADLALLVDGLRAEREQGITIDVAYRYFATAHRSFVLADTPGHVQYTRNMVTGASTADVAVVLVDARAGLIEQSRRHATIAALLGVGHLVLAVNKMDLVGWSEDVFDTILADFAALADRRGVRSWSAVPISALLGDNVVDRSANTGWYAGPPLLELLETLPVPGTDDPALGWRFPVQLVVRPRTAAYPDYRGYSGRVAAGTVRVGDAVTVLPAGASTTVVGIDTYDGPLDEAAAGRSVVLRLADDLDISRGDLLTGAGRPPAVTREITATVCWLATEPLAAGSRWRLRQATRDVRAVVTEVTSVLDVTTGESRPAGTLALNDIGTVTLRTAEPLVVDPYAASRRTGGLLLVDELTGASAGAGMVTEQRCPPGTD